MTEANDANAKAQGDTRTDGEVLRVIARVFALTPKQQPTAERLHEIADRLDRADKLASQVGES